MKNCYSIKVPEEMKKILEILAEKKGETLEKYVEDIIAEASPKIQPPKRSSGIMDKNGREIFEGDIVEWEEVLDKDCIYDEAETYLKRGMVTYQNGYFSCDDGNPFFLCLNTSNNKNNWVEIINSV